MFFDGAPEARGIRIGGHAFKHDLGGANGQRAVGNIGVAGNPAHIGGAPEYVVRLVVEHPFQRHDAAKQIAAGAVLHAFGLAGGAGSVKNKQRMLGIHPFRFAFAGLVGHQILPPNIAAFNHGHLRIGARQHHHFFHAGAVATGQRFVYRGFQRHLFAAAHAFVGSDNHFGCGIFYAVFYRTGRKTAKHHRMDGTDARTGLHRHHGIGHHRHIHHHAVAFLHTQ